MMSMKKKRTIRLKDPRLRKARYELRTLLRLVWEKQISDLYDKIETIRDDDSLELDTKIQRKAQIDKQIEAIDFAYLHGPHGCRLCGDRDADLTYNPCNSTWFCESCYKSNQEFYKKNPHPEGLDWRELYP